MPRYAFRVEYDGAPFAGWQAQADQPSVQGSIESALARLDPGFRSGARIAAAGRTDAHPGGITQGQTQSSRHAAAEQRDTVGDVRRRAGQPGLDAVGQQQFPVQVGNAACDVGAAQINSDIMHLPILPSQTRLINSSWR